MKAARAFKYGPADVVQLVELDKPVPTEEQVLVKVVAASVNVADLTFTGGFARLFVGLSRPKDPRLGRDIAGRVEAVGSQVITFKPGDDVFGAALGGFAEYVVTRQKNLVLKPANISYEQAAAVPIGAITALQGLRDKAKVQPGQKVLIYSSSGSVGTFSVQIARWLGAEVTAVCSPLNLEMARSMGADHVIDYTREDFTRGSQKYDLIFGVNGYHPISDYRRVLAPKGIYLMVGAAHDRLFAAFFQTMFFGRLYTRADEQQFRFMGIAEINQPDLLVLKDLLESGKIVPFIEKRYPFSQAGEALRYVANGHARGKVIINVETTSSAA